MTTENLVRCGTCAGLGSVSRSEGAGWAVCPSCAGSGLGAPQEEPPQAGERGRDAALAEAERRLTANQRETEELAAKVERLRLAVAEAHARARAATDEARTARRVVRALLWRLDLLGDLAPSAARAAGEAVLEKGGEERARKNIEHAAPHAWTRVAGRPLTPEEEHALRLRCMNAPEAFQADVDALLVSLTELRNRGTVGEAFQAAVAHGFPMQIMRAMDQGREEGAQKACLALVEGTRGIHDGTDGPLDLPIPTLTALDALAPALREAVLDCVRRIEERTARQLLERVRGLLTPGAR